MKVTHIERQNISLSGFSIGTRLSIAYIYMHKEDIK